MRYDILAVQMNIFPINFHSSRYDKRSSLSRFAESEKRAFYLLTNRERARLQTHERKIFAQQQSQKVKPVSIFISLYSTVNYQNNDTLQTLPF